MSGTKRGRRTALGACAALSVAALGTLGSTAAVAAQPSDPNPLSTNVPYLAWRGEHVRLVKCTDDLPGGDVEALRAAPRTLTGGLDLGVHTDVIVEDWSGNADFKPAVAPGTVDLFMDSAGDLCVKADVLSQYAGLAQIKLMVTLDPGEDSGLADIVTRSEILGVHQFLSGWMTLSAPTLTGGGGDYDAGGADGTLSARVTGTLPLGNSFADLGLGSTLTLPSGWPDLAAKLASDRNPDNHAPQYRWDIHDDQQPGTACVNVDNCSGGLAFTRIFDADGPGGALGAFALPDTTPDTIGPFDPQRPDETLLGDGAITADDAPMPAARIDVTLAPNGGGATDISGTGSLHKADKRVSYSRDGSGAATPSNLYAPFYSAYIPATADGSWMLFGTPVSGTDGPAMGNDFPGFLVGDGRGGEGDLADTDNTYDYWDIAHVFDAAAGASTRCLNRSDVAPTRRLQPEGAQSVAVYTDEHGEAQVDYRPGTGAYYDNLAGVVRNANGGCDLEGVDVLGTASISAESKYPYQPTTDLSPRVSAPVTTAVHSLFTKYLTQWPKGAGPDNAVTRLIVAHAQDVDGSPYANEAVCFIKGNPNGSYLPYVYNGDNDPTIGGYDVTGSAPVTVATHPGQLCMETNAAGNAAIEVVNSDGNVADVVADFVSEAIRREFPVDFGTAIPQPQAPGPNPIGGGQPQAGGDVTTPVPPAAARQVPSAAAEAKVDAIVAASGAKAAAPKKASKAFVVRFARLKTTAAGKRTLVVRIDGGAAGKAKVRIKLFDKKGKTQATVIRTLAARRTVTVPKLTIAKTISRASIKVIG
jgi:hypothetical protein